MGIDGIFATIAAILIAVLVEQFATPASAASSTGPTRMSIAQVESLAAATINQNGLNTISPTMAVSIALVESGDINNPAAGIATNAIRQETGGRESVGIMQTLVSTATQMYDMGFKAYGPPTKQTLLDPAVSMYFGCAYLAWLRTYAGTFHTDDFIVQSYNAGPANPDQPYLVKYEIALNNVEYGP